MPLPRPFTLSLVPKTCFRLFAILGLLMACQPQNGVPSLTTNKLAHDTTTESATIGSAINSAVSGPADNATNSMSSMTNAVITDTDTAAHQDPAPVIAIPQEAPEEEEAGQPEIVKPAPPPVPPAFEPHMVLSQSENVLQSLLGNADIIRREGTVKIWQYRLDHCVFDFFLIPDEDGLYGVKDWAYRATRLGTNANELLCRRALAKDRMKPDNN